MLFDSSTTLQHECCCGRTFLQTNAYSNHRKSCKKSKTRLSSALSSARDNWERRKKARIAEPSEGSHQSDLTSLPQHLGNSGVSHTPCASNDPGTSTRNPPTTSPNMVQPLHDDAPLLALPTQLPEAMASNDEVGSCFCTLHCIELT